jgi:hypothetical protein
MVPSPEAFAHWAAHHRLQMPSSESALSARAGALRNTPDTPPNRCLNDLRGDECPFVQWLRQFALVDGTLPHYHRFV